MNPDRVKRLGVELVPIVAALVLAGCGSAKPATRPPPAPQVSVVTVHSSSVSITTDLPGRTSAYLVAQVRAEPSHADPARFREMQAQAREVDRQRVQIAVRIAELQGGFNEIG